MTFSQRSRRLALGATAVLALALAAAPTIAADHAVSIVDKTFDPKDITIAAGDTVTWTVTKSIGEPHSVTSGKLGDTNAGSEFDSGIKLNANGDTFQHTFETPGTYPYFCTVHASEMTGVVTVEAAGESTAPSGATASEAPPSAPPASGAPAASPGASGSPAASPEPEPHEPVPAENRLIGGVILIAALVILFGLNLLWRRVNKA